MRSTQVFGALHRKLGGSNTTLIGHITTDGLLIGCKISVLSTRFQKLA